MRTWLLQRLAFLTFAPFLAPDAVESASAQMLSVTFMADVKAEGGRGGGVEGEGFVGRRPLGKVY